MSTDGSKRTIEGRPRTLNLRNGESGDIGGRCVQVFEDGMGRVKLIVTDRFTIYTTPPQPDNVSESARAGR